MMVMVASSEKGSVMEVSFGSESFWFKLNEREWRSLSRMPRVIPEAEAVSQLTIKRVI